MDHVKNEVETLNQNAVDDYFGQEGFFDIESEQHEDEQINSTLSFSEVYHKVFHSSPSSQLHLIKIEQQMNIMYTDAIKKRDVEVEDVRMLQAREMERMCDYGPSNSNLPQLVHSHVAQIQKLESKHATSLMTLKQDFKKQFQKFVFDLYDDKLDEEHINVADDINEDVIRRELVNTEGIITINDVIPNNKQESKYKYMSTLWNYFGNRNQPQHVDDFEVVPHPASTFTPFASSKHTIFRVTVPRFLIHVAYDSPSILSKSKVFANETDELIFRSRERRQMTGSVGARAFISNCYALVDETNHVKNFAWTTRGYDHIQHDAMETCAPELHFDDLEDQVKQAQDVIKTNVQIGNHFVTCHSNLHYVHLMYHIITQEPKSSQDIYETEVTLDESKTSDYDLIMNGYESAFDSMRDCGVRGLSLSLPIITTQRHPKTKQLRKVRNQTLYSGDELLFQLQDILNIIKKKSLVLEDIFLFLPNNPKHSSGNFYKQLEFLIRDNFQNPDDAMDPAEVIVLSDTMSHRPTSGDVPH
ncbi:hypothetical protein AKO1_013331 [Acrasis kona]|uniref:Uncharacterized protein n=1 Tax=Acrasis kona TaxID=1008807 RepID=A0AAW2YZB2_9EUKA